MKEIFFVSAKKKDGSFLIRESAIDPGDFVLSIMKDKKFAHYIISQRRALHCLYSIGNGPMIRGMLLRYVSFITF